MLPLFPSSSRPYAVALAAAAVFAFLSWTTAAPASAMPIVSRGDFGLSVGTLPPSAGTGSWFSGDRASIVGPENGVTPLVGPTMLRFNDTSFTGPGSSTPAEAFQVVDATGAAGQTLELSAYFNRVAGDSQTDDLFLLQLLAFGGNYVNTLPAFSTALASTPLAQLNADADETTWEQLVTDPLLLPDETSFLVVYLIASENVFNDLVAPEFDGHYADNVSFVPEPGTATLALVGLLVVACTKRLRHS